MVSKHIFSSTTRTVPTADTKNRAGGKAYKFAADHALAQYAATGCFGGIFYASAAEQIEWVLDAAAHVDDEFLAKTAIYARERGQMKDVPALLVALLAARGAAELDVAFERVIDNGRMLRNFVQIVRSGVTGRRSFGSRVKRLITRWLDARSDAAVFRASVGNDPSLADIIKMVHPAPRSASRRALYGYLLGKAHDPSALPKLVTDFEHFKTHGGKEVPDVPFQLLTILELTTRQWAHVARHAGWQMTRMNLNTFVRHHVFDDPAVGPEMVELVAKRLADPEAIASARAFPYQLMVAWQAASTQLPPEIRDALGDAMEIAVANVPRIEGNVYVLPDVSGSMHSPVTGFRKGSTTAVRCIDVAALVAAAFMRRNRRTVVLPFHDRVESCSLDRRDSIMTNATTLARLPSGGTDCAEPLRELNRRHAKGNLVVFVSDNQSWIDTTRRWNPGTNVMEQWEQYKRRNPKAKLVCIDVQPYATSQAPDRADILNVGGFSDAVFDVIAAFVADTLTPGHWAGEIAAMKL